MNLRPVFYIFGILLCALSISMLIPMLVDIYYMNNDWKVFLLCSFITGFFGGLMVLTTTNDDMQLTTKQGFMMISICWIGLSLFSALPFWLSALDISLTDAVFESVSGITTTGATALTGLETLPKGILIWRAVLQWLGGIGIIIMALSVLPFLKIGGMQLFQTELSESEKGTPRARTFASAIGLIYIFLTFICMVCYHLSGMNYFDSAAHAMTTIATGGYATYDTSFFHYESAAPLIVGCIFMVVGGVPFVLLLKAFKGNLRPLLRDQQVKWFLITFTIAALICTIVLTFQHDAPLGASLLHSFFNVISVITGTGYASADYGQWGSTVVCLIMFLTFMGACAGSTSCGIKIFRFQVLAATVRVQVKKLLYPNGVFIPQFAGKPLPKDVPSAVMSFFFLYIISFAILSMALSFVGLDFITAISGAATSISNVGPGLGDIIGPSGNFQSLPDSAKWILCTGMILGRLEIFTIIVMLSPYFWRK